VSFLNQDQKSCTNSYVELKGYVGGKVPYETHRMDLGPKLLTVNTDEARALTQSFLVERSAQQLMWGCSIGIVYFKIYCHVVHKQKTLFYRPNSLRVGGLSKLSCPSIVDDDDG
jgi:hypothetical protein